MHSSTRTILSIAAGLAALGTASADTITKQITTVNAYANSNTDFLVSFPAAGVPDANGWNYGYYNVTAAGDSGAATDYDYLTEFTQFTTGQTRGSGFGIASSGAPWTTVGANNDGHPNGANSAPNQEQWAIRRYTVQAGVPAAVDLNWALGASNTNGTGTTLNVYRNGVPIANATTSTAAGQNGVVSFTNLAVGDVIDFALSPEGTGGAADRADGSDGSSFGGFLGSTTVQNLTFETVGVIADSDAEFSGIQGQNDWTNGYIISPNNNQPANGDSPGGTFTAFAGGDGQGAWDGTGQQWNNANWDLQTGAAQPWTFLAAENAHPNGTNQPEEHWVTRRWELPAGEEGDLLLEYNLSKPNNGGGTTLFVLQNGEVIDSISSSSSAIESGFIEVLDAQPGDIFDFALSPLFGSNTTDGGDSSNFDATIHLLIPEPATASLLGLSAAALLLRRRRS